MSSRFLNGFPRLAVTAIFIPAFCAVGNPIALAQSSAAVTIRVAAAADLQPVLPGLLKDYEKQTGLHVEVSYGPSGTLTMQILNGAPFDLFLSADMSYPARISGAGLSTAPTPYAKGTLVLWARKDSSIQPLSLETLRSPALHRLAIANPDHAPYGRAAYSALEQMKLLDALKPKFVIAENIAQAAQFAESGNADAGLISLAAALTPRFSSEGTYVVVPADSYPPIVQGAIVLTKSSGAAAAQRLLQFLLSKPEQDALAARGLKPAN
jgi:molybdate transport system substrate-binding protein